MQTSAVNGKSNPTNADIAAELAAMSEAAPPPNETPPPAASPAADPPAEEPAADPAPEPEKVDEPVDPEAARRMAAGQKQEERIRRMMAEERKALAAERKKMQDEIAAERESFKKEHAASIEEARAFAALKARARQDPDAILSALGLDETDADLAMRALYPRTKAGKEDPKAREGTARALREREAQDRISAAEKRAEEAVKRAEELAKRYEDDQRAAASARAANEWLDAAQKTVAPTSAPVLAKWLEKNPARARQRIGEVATEMLDRDGVVPDHAEVIAEVESRRRAEMEADGHDIDAYIGKAAPAKKPNGAGPSKTLGQAGGAPAAPKPKLTGAELLDDIKRKIELGQLDD